MPAARTRIRTSPGPAAGSGTATGWSTSGVPYSSNTMMIAITRPSLRAAWLTRAGGVVLGDGQEDGRESGGCGDREHPAECGAERSRLCPRPGGQAQPALQDDREDRGADRPAQPLQDV